MRVGIVRVGPTEVTRQGLRQETCSVRASAELPFGPNAPQVGFVDGLNLFEVGIAFAREFWRMAGHPYGGENFSVLQFAQIRGVCADWENGRDLEKILALEITGLELRTPAGDLSRTPFQSVAQITRCEDGRCDDDGLLAVLLALLVHESGQDGRFRGGRGQYSTTVGFALWRVVRALRLRRCLPHGRRHGPV